MNQVDSFKKRTTLQLVFLSLINSTRFSTNLYKLVVTALAAVVVVDYSKVDCPQVVRNKLKVNHQQIERQRTICTRHFAANFFFQRKRQQK